MEKFENQVFEYLKKVSKHLYQDESGNYMKIIVDRENVKILKQIRGKYELKDYIYKSTSNSYKENAKCVISHDLFLIPKYRGIKYHSVRQNKWRKSEIENILTSINI